MEYLVGIGAVISLIGLAGIIYSIVALRRAKKTASSDDDLRGKIQAIMPINLGAFFVSIIGLICVVIGVVLG